MDPSVFLPLSTEDAGGKQSQLSGDFLSPAICFPAKAGGHFEVGTIVNTNRKPTTS